MKTPQNTVNDFIGKYGTTNSSIDGVGFQQYNDIDTGAEESRMSSERNSKITSGALLGGTTGLSIGTAAGLFLPTAVGAGAGTAAAAGGAAAGAAAGGGFGGLLGPITALAGLGLGALFGGIFGNSAKEEEEERMRIAQIKQDNANEFWRTGALSTALRNKALEEYGDTTRYNLLSGAALGVEKVHTSDGMAYRKPNARLDVGELVVSKSGNKWHTVDGNPNVTDGELGHLKKGEKVATDAMRVPGTNMTFAELYPYAHAAGKDDEFWDTQAMTRNAMGIGWLPGYRGSFEWLPGYWGGLESVGGLGNIFSTGLGFIQSKSDYDDADNNVPRVTDIKPSNDYDGVARDLMLGRSVSAYPQMRAIAQTGAAQQYRNN